MTLTPERLAELREYPLSIWPHAEVVPPLDLLAEKDAEIFEAQAAAVRGYAAALDDVARDLTTDQRLVPGLVLAKKIAERTADAISRGELS